jgi:hypothetical protein
MGGLCRGCLLAWLDMCTRFVCSVPALITLVTGPAICQDPTHTFIALAGSSKQPCRAPASAQSAQQQRPCCPASQHPSTTAAAAGCMGSCSASCRAPCVEGDQHQQHSRGYQHRGLGHHHAERWARVGDMKGGGGGCALCAAHLFGCHMHHW